MGKWNALTNQDQKTGQKQVYCRNELNQKVNCHFDHSIKLDIIKSRLGLRVQKQS